jgi:putative hydrolase of the HAD superfamily
MITTVIFDLDDTLYPERDYCRSGFRRASTHLAGLSDKHNKDHIFDVLWGQFTAGNQTRTFDATLEELGLPDNGGLIRELVEVYRTHVPTITLPVETQRTLDELSATYALALLTDGFLPAQKLKVQALGIERYFQAIVYTEELGRQFWKPSPRGFQTLIDVLHVTPSEAAYVADNEMKDFIAPNDLGFATIQLLCPQRLHRGTSDLPNAAALHQIAEITQLPGLLRRL